MIEEQIIGAGLHSVEDFNLLVSKLDLIEFSDPGKILWEHISSYYEKDPNSLQASIPIIEERLRRGYPKHCEGFIEILNRAQPSGINNIIDELITFKRYNIGLKLSSACLKDNNHKKIKRLMEEYDEVEGIKDEEDKDEILRGVPSEEMVRDLRPENLLRMYPGAFNDMVGGEGVPPQTHIGVIALPGSGKTLFAVNLACGMCNDGHKVLYISNEDSRAKLHTRFMSRFSDMTKQEIIAEPAKADKRAFKRGYNNLLFSPTVNSFPSIIRVIEKYEPRVLIIDQLRQLSINGLSGLEHISSAGKQARRIGKKYDMVVVTLTQAGEARNKSGVPYKKLMLDMGDVFGSNIDYPGDLDILLGIGANEEYLDSNRRMLTLAKDKEGIGLISRTVYLDLQRSKILSKL